MKTSAKTFLKELRNFDVDILGPLIIIASSVYEMWLNSHSLPSLSAERISTPMCCIYIVYSLFLISVAAYQKFIPHTSPDL